MTQQPAAGQPAGARPWTAPRLLMLAGAVCFLLAALLAGGVLDFSPALAWAFGGFCAWMLSAVA